MESITENSNMEGELLEKGTYKNIYSQSYSLSFFSMLWLIFKRQIRLLARDKLIVIGILVGYLVASIFLGFVFYDVTSNNSKLSVFGAFEFQIILLLFGPVAEFGTILEQKKVLSKQTTSSI